MKLLKNTQFMKLWGNQILLQIAFNMTNFTSLLLIDQLTSSRFALAQFYTAITIPAFVVGLFAGAIVDISSKRNIMLLTDAALCILFLSLAFFTNNYWAILSIAFAAATVSQFFTPAEAATIPHIVEEKQLNNANALFLFTGLGAVIVGYALAGPVIDFGGETGNVGYQMAFIFSGILTGIGFILRLSLKSVDHRLPIVSRDKLIARAIAMTKESIDVTKKDARIWLPIFLLTLVQFNIGVMSILFIDFVKTFLNLKTTATSLVLILPMTIGLAIGIYALEVFEKKHKWRRGLVIDLGAFLFGTIILILGLSASYLPQFGANANILRIITAIVSGAVGLCAVLIAVHARTILQENTPEKMLGRIFALVTVAGAAVTPVPILILALLTEKMDVATIFVFFGILLLLISWSIKPMLLKKIT
jgi:MFS family permease